MMQTTTTERNAVSYLMSGTIFSATFAGSINLSKYNKKEISKQELIQDTAKLAIQGGLGTGSAVAATNSIEKGDFLNAMAIVGLGALSVYATQKVFEAIEPKSIKKGNDLERWSRYEREEALKNAGKKQDG